MNHPTVDELLLLAYDELPEHRATPVEAHLDACGACQEKLAQLERGRVALDLATPSRHRRAVVWATVGLAAAAVLAVVVIRSEPSVPSTEHWTPTMTWSATAGYVAGGKALIDIDARLTRLEQERYRGLPN